jgi:hypothetical protein
MKTLTELKLMWTELRNICVNQRDEIETQFYQFEEGTHREIIWHWFDDECFKLTGKGWFEINNK